MLEAYLKYKEIHYTCRQVKHWHPNGEFAGWTEIPAVDVARVAFFPAHPFQYLPKPGVYYAETNP